MCNLLQLNRGIAMKASQIYLILLLWGGACGTFLFSDEVSLDPEQFEEVKRLFGAGKGGQASIMVKPDLSGLGEQAAGAGKGLMKNLVSGVVEDFAEAARSGEFGRHATSGFKDITQQGAGAFTEAMSNPRLRAQLKRGGSEFSST